MEPCLQGVRKEKVNPMIFIYVEKTSFEEKVNPMIFIYVEKVSFEEKVNPMIFIYVEKTSFEEKVNPMIFIYVEKTSFEEKEPRRTSHRSVFKFHRAQLLLKHHKLYAISLNKNNFL